MCQASTKICKCGQGEASLHFINNVLPENVVRGIHCPNCSSAVEFDKETMLEDNGWIIEFEVEGARLFAKDMGVSEDEITPEFIFDSGYCTWVGYTPSDRTDSFDEKKAIIDLAKTDRARYFEELKNWSINRVNKLSDEGWRKAVKETA